MSPSQYVSSSNIFSFLLDSILLYPIKHEIYLTEFLVQPLLLAHPLKWNLNFDEKLYDFVLLCNFVSIYILGSNDLYAWWQVPGKPQIENIFFFGFKTTKISLKLLRMLRPFPVRYTKCPHLCLIHQKTPYFWHNWYHVNRAHKVEVPSSKSINLFRF